VQSASGAIRYSAELADGAPGRRHRVHGLLLLDMPLSALDLPTWDDVRPAARLLAGREFPPALPTTVAQLDGVGWSASGVLDHAVRLFNNLNMHSVRADLTAVRRAGYAGVTVRQIASAAAVSPALVIDHYGSK
jgi:hypothetical protein